MNFKRFFKLLLLCLCFVMLCTQTGFAAAEFNSKTNNLLIQTDGGNTKYVLEEGTITVRSKADNTLVYADQFPINEDGSFQYKFKFNHKIDDYNVYIRDTYGNPVTQYVTTVDSDAVMSVLLDIGLDNDGLFISENEKATLKATITNAFGDECNCNLILATYTDKGRLTSIQLSDVLRIRYDADTYDELLTMNVPKDTATIKGFMLSDVVSITPLAVSAERKLSNYITLPNIISDNMMVQADQPINIWGKASYVGETITAEITDESGAIVTNGETVVSNDGTFHIEMAATEANRNCTLKVYTDAESKTINNVLIGELWLMGGQSNMELKVNTLSASVKNQILPSSEISDIRLFTAQSISGSEPQDEVAGTWVVANSQTVGNFSAVGYVAIKEIYDTLGVPVGGIDTSFGGTPMSYWVAPENELGLRSGSGYNGKIAPFTNLNIKGIMWYQGEHGDDRIPVTIDNSESFVTKFDNLIGSWRNAWQKSDMPVVFVQLPVGNIDFSKVRLAQLEAYKTIEDTAMAVIVDCVPNSALYPSEEPIHFHNKIPVGKRVAYSALKHFYGYDIHDGVGPMLESVQFANGKAILTLSNVEDGLTTNDGQNPKYFVIAGSDGVFYAAEATITASNQITVHSDKVASPKVVRYLMEYDDGTCDPSNNKYPNVNLVNSAGIPCGSFVAK